MKKFIDSFTVKIPIWILYVSCLAFAVLYYAFLLQTGLLMKTMASSIAKTELLGIHNKCISDYEKDNQEFHLKVSQVIISDDSVVQKVMVSWESSFSDASITLNIMSTAEC